MFQTKPRNFKLKIRNTKMYKLYKDDKRYNNKVFDSYEEGRKYVRRLVTKLLGNYYDDFSWTGFSIRKN